MLIFLKDAILSIILMKVIYLLLPKSIKRLIKGLVKMASLTFINIRKYFKITHKVTHKHYKQYKVRKLKKKSKEHKPDNVIELHKYKKAE